MRQEFTIWVRQAEKKVRPAQKPTVEECVHQYKHACLDSASRISWILWAAKHLPDRLHAVAGRVKESDPRVKRVMEMVLAWARKKS